MKSKRITITPVEDFTIKSALSQHLYTFKIGNIYKYYPETGLINVDNGQLYVGIEFRNKFRKATFFEILLNLIFGNL